jgi:hypothetical protein
MASWKKVIVSGSAAALLAVTASAGFTGSFFGDGSGLSGVAGTFPTTPLGGAALETTKFFVNDGASKFISGSQVAAYVYSGVSGDATIAAGGALTIAASAVEGTMLNSNVADGATVQLTGNQLSVIKVPNALTVGAGLLSGGTFDGAAARTVSVDSGSFLPYISGAVFSTVSGDITINSAGVAAIGSGVIVNGDVNASAAIAYTKLNFAGSSFVSASSLSSGAQGEVAITVNGAAQSAVDLGLQTTDSPTFAGVTADAVQIGITGTNEIDTTSGNLTIDSAGGLVTIDDNLSVTGNATITGDLVVSGTASFQNTQNLLVADRFALFASGSVATGDGGIVIQQATQNVGELFGYDSGAGRWAFTSSFSADTSAFTPAAYAGVVEFTAGSPSSDPLYGGSSNGYGTIFVNTSNGEIFIYS